MSYQVIARKYRPQRFSDVVGQEHVTQTLAHAIQRNRIAHAYLFCGPRGTGKTTIARIFAKCLNATDGPRVDFTEEDPRCVEITEGRSLDVLEIDGASNNGVEQVRELRDTCRYAPAVSKFKIYIIDEVHMLSAAAFNALLKTLEEPPAHVKFMFATTDPEKVLPTILSRCQRFDLRRIPVKLIVSHLQRIAAQEKVSIEDTALHAIARGADGGMRDAESALDQLISFCGSKIAEEDVLSMFGLTAQNQILSVTKAILDGEVEPALRELNDLCQHGKELGRLLSDLLSHFRNLLIFQVSRGDTSLLQVSEVEMASLSGQSATATTEALTRIMEVLCEAESRLRSAASKRIFVETALVKAIEARQAVNIDTVLKQLAQMRATAGANPAPGMAAAEATTREARLPALASSARSTDTPKSPHLTPPAAATAPSAASLTMKETPVMPAPATGGLEQLWRDLIESVGRASPFTRSYLLEAFPVSLAGRVLTVGFDKEFADHLSLVDNPRNHTLIATKLSELGHPGMQIRFVVAEAPERPPLQEGPTPAATSTPEPRAARPPAKPSAKTPDPKDFKNDPLIQKALEIFKARIVEVRS